MVNILVTKVFVENNLSFIITKYTKQNNWPTLKKVSLILYTLYFDIWYLNQ